MLKRPRMQLDKRSRGKKSNHEVEKVTYVSMKVNHERFCQFVLRIDGKASKIITVKCMLNVNIGSFGSFNLGKHKLANSVRFM